MDETEIPEGARLFLAFVEAQDVVFDPAVHARLDMRVVDADQAQGAGEYATLDVLTENPGIGLLAEGRRTHVLFSASETGEPADAILRLRGVVTPLTNLDGNSVTIQFVAQPDDAPAIMRAYARTLAVAPYVDPLVSRVPEVPDDGSPDTWEPGEVLEARSSEFDIDPITHAHALSDYLVGERVVDIGPRHDRAALSVGAGDPPVSRATMEVAVEFEQGGEGFVDAWSRITPEAVRTLTPLGDQLEQAGGIGSGSGWSVVRAKSGRSFGHTAALFRTGRKVTWTANQGLGSQFSGDCFEVAPISYENQRFFSYLMKWSASYSRREVVTIEATADIQPFLGTASRAEVIDPVSLDSVTEDLDTEEWEPNKAYAVGDRVQRDGSCWECRWAHVSKAFFTITPDPGDQQILFVQLPTPSAGGTADVIVQWVRVPSRSALGDRRKPSFFDSDRGKQVLAHCVLRARAFLRHRMRCVTVSGRGPWDLLHDLTCRDSIRLEDPTFPGGSVVGKVVNYRKVWSGRTRSRYVEFELGVSVGTGAPFDEPFAGDAYTPAWSGYAFAPAGQPDRYDEGVAWSVSGPAPRVPVDLYRLGQPGYAVLGVTWTNTYPDQIAAARRWEATGRRPTEGVATVPTQFSLRMRSLSAGGTMLRELTVSCSPVRGPMGVNLSDGT